MTTRKSRRNFYANFSLEQLESRLLYEASGLEVVSELSQLQRVTYTDELGRLVTIKLKGPGSGTVTFADEGPGNPISIDVTGTTEKSSILIKISKAKQALSDIGAVTVAGPLKSFIGKGIAMAGDFTVTGFIGKISLAGVWKVQSTLSIGSGQPADDRMVTLDLGSVNDLNIDCAYGIKTIKAAFWKDNKSDQDFINAPWMLSLNIYMDFDSVVTLTDASSPLRALKSMRAWHVANVDFITNGYIQKIQVLQWDAGVIQAADISSLTVTGSRNQNLAGDFGATITLTEGDVNTLYARAKIAGAVAQLLP